MRTLSFDCNLLSNILVFTQDLLTCINNSKNTHENQLFMVRQPTKAAFFLLYVRYAMFLCPLYCTMANPICVA